MKKIYDLLGRTAKIVGYVAILLEVLSFIRERIEKISPEVKNDTAYEAGTPATI